MLCWNQETFVILNSWNIFMWVFWSRIETLCTWANSLLWCRCCWTANYCLVGNLGRNFLTFLILNALMEVGISTSLQIPRTSWTRQTTPTTTFHFPMFQVTFTGRNFSRNAYWSHETLLLFLLKLCPLVNSLASDRLMETNKKFQVKI